MPALMKLSSNVDKVLASLEKVKAARLASIYQVAAEVAIQALADAQTISPVDTGLYRAAHDLTINEPSSFQPSTTSTVTDTGIPPPAVAPRGETVPEQLDLAQSRLDGARSTFTGSMSIFLTNNLQYAWALENGHSQQAPQGVYGIVRQRAIENFKKGGLSV